MFSGRHRVPVSEFFASGRRDITRSPFFIVYTKSNSLGHNRLSVVVKKGIGAVSRHLIKRVVMGVVEKLGNKSSDVVIIVLPKAKELTKTMLRDEVKNALQKTFN